MVSSYKFCVFFEGGMLICLEIIVLDNLKKGFAWRSFFVFSESVAHNIDLHTSHSQMEMSSSTSTIT